MQIQFFNFSLIKHIIYLSLLNNSRTPEAGLHCKLLVIVNALLGHQGIPYSIREALPVRSLHNIWEFKLETRPHCVYFSVNKPFHLCQQRALYPFTHIYWGRVFLLRNTPLQVLFRATLTKWDVNSSDHDPNSVGDCFPNLPGQGSTFFLLQLGLKRLCIEKIAFLKQRSTKCFSAASHEEEENRKTIDIVEWACTCGWSSPFEAEVTDSDGGKTPAPLRDGRHFGRASVAVALPTGTAVMLGVVVLEDCATLMAQLVQEKNNNNRNFIDQEESNLTLSKFCLVTCRHGLRNRCRWTQTVNIALDRKVLTVGGRGRGCVSLTEMRELGFQ